MTTSIYRIAGELLWGQGKHFLPLHFILYRRLKVSIILFPRYVSNLNLKSFTK